MRTDPYSLCATHRPWYKKKLAVSGSVILLIFIVVVILGSLLGVQNRNRKETDIRESLLHLSATFLFSSVDTSTTQSPFDVKATANATILWEKDKWNVRNELNIDPGK